MSDNEATRALERLQEVARTRHFTIRVIEGPDRDQVFHLDTADPGPCLVGTSPACTIQLTDPHVSRRHLSLEVESDVLRMTDLGSLNGTYCGALRAYDVALVGGERISLARTTVLEVSRTAEAGQIAVSDRSKFGRLIGSSLAMRRLYPLCERLAASSVPVLIEGETGTGKEVLAEALHELGPRQDGAFVVFDCSAVTPSLVESHLFGHERGAFTGANSTRKGVFELAHGGTLFIDEIGDLELALQARLLRAIERGEVCRVGSEVWQKVDVRILAATRRDLDKEVQEGRFRNDLFYRLAVTRIELPPLRKRAGDVAILARHFWDQVGGQDLPPPYEAFERFESYNWPGNVRELYNAVARRLALGQLADEGPDPGSDGGDLVEKILALNLPLPAAKQRLMGEFERSYVERVLQRHGGSARRAAEASGIARRYFNLLRARHARDDTDDA